MGNKNKYKIVPFKTILQVALLNDHPVVFTQWDLLKHLKTQDSG